MIRGSLSLFAPRVRSLLTTKILSRVSALAMIVSLLLAMMIPFPALQVRASSVGTGETGSASPPEPFLIHAAPWSTELFSSVFTSVGTVTDALRPAKVPAGLTAGKLPAVYERISGALLAFIKPTSNPPVNPDPPPSQPASVVDFDFDNDGKADIGRWHSANAELKVKNSNGGSYSEFTVGCAPPMTGCVPPVLAPGDFNGDGKTDAAVFSSGTWKYKTSTSGSEQTISWGTAGDIPVAGD